MDLKHLFYFIVAIVLTGCLSSTCNSPEFIKKTTGRYLYNSDEVIEVFFENNELYLKWRGANNIKPLKVDDNTFFVKEMNEKLQFLNNPSNQKEYIVLIPKTSNDTLQYNFRKLAKSEITGSEYLTEKKFDKALEAYLNIQKNDSLDSSIKEDGFNSMGYKKLREERYEEALAIFKININLYPKSSNVYDSYADALKRSGDTIQAIEYYKKSLSIDSGNRNAKKFIEKYETIK